MSETTKEPQIIIVKKIIKKTKHPHHGGSWKIAYADFVTAMMAFFLLMWLLSMLNKYQLMGISNYFNKPLKNVFVDNKKNDINKPKEPKEQTKKYKLQLISKEKVAIDARSRGDSKNNGTAIAQKNQEDKKASGQQDDKNLGKEQQNAKASQEGMQDKKLLELKKQFEAEINKDSKLKKYKEQLDFVITKDGLKVVLHDLENKPMFSLGKADFEVYASRILQWLSTKINKSGRRVSIIGYTDSKPYPNQTDYSNWELSADRANATRRALTRNGMKPDHILRVQGASDSILLDKKVGENPINRRIDIILLTDDAAKRMLEN